MESEFEPVVRTEETPEARIVVLDLPGFRKEDLRVQVNNRGNLIISAERGVKEMEERTKVDGRLEKMQNGRNRFRKVIGVPDNVNIDGITAKLKDQVLRVSLPFIQKKQTSPINSAGKLHVADLPEQSKPEQRSSPVNNLQERPPAPQSARVPEVIGSDDCKEKASPGADERKGEVIRSDDCKEKASPGADERKGSLEEKKREVPKHAQDIVHGEPPIISTPTQAVSAVKPGSAPDKSEFKPFKSQPRKHDDESRLPSSNDEFPEKRVQIPSSTTRSLFSNRAGVLLIASTVLVLCAGMYFSYILRSRKAD